MLIILTACAFSLRCASFSCTRRPARCAPASTPAGTCSTYVRRLLLRRCRYFHDVGLSAHDEPENGRHFRAAAPPAAAAGRAARGLDGRGRAVADVSGAHAHARRHLGAARRGAARSGHGALLVSVYAHCALCALADPLRRDPGARQVRAGVSVRAGGGRVGAYDPDDGAAGWCGAVCRSGHFRQAQDLRRAHGHVRARLPARQLRKKDPELAACARRGRVARGDLGRHMGAHGAHGRV